MPFTMLSMFCIIKGSFEQLNSENKNQKKGVSGLASYTPRCKLLAESTSVFRYYTDFEGFVQGVIHHHSFSCASEAHKDVKTGQGVVRLPNAKQTPYKERERL